jgi:hypothetical protein
MARDEPDLDGGWLESTEGDLDPDLAEEAGYPWDPPERNALLPLVLRLVAVVLLLVLVGSVVLPAVR